MPDPKRIQLRRTRGWRKPSGAVVVARGTAYGNPFRIGGIVEVRDEMGPTGLEVTITRDLAVALFRADLDSNPGWRAQAATELAGRDLACWCSLDQLCHGDVWLAIANGDPDA